MIRAVRRASGSILVGDSPGTTGTLKAAEKCGILARLPRGRRPPPPPRPLRSHRRHPLPRRRHRKKFALARPYAAADKIISLLERGLTPPLAGIDLVGSARDVRFNFAPHSMLSLADRIPGWAADLGR